MRRLKFPDLYFSVICRRYSRCLRHEHLIVFVFFSRTTEPILTKLSTQSLWIKGILCVFFSSNEGSRPFPRGYISNMRKTHNAIINKNSSLESLRQFQPNISENIVRLRKLECVKWRTTAFSIGRKKRKKIENS